ncbi:DEAD/DEAH box helicase [Eggerthella timonensis]|uniref:DEAD/DEAH box helicase n=1 Tax=Eggerthella timonensis TaxID=1871008 RepID=UPI000C78E668|nr:DEAD/DEAH box helicase [Eggerthella timonensis]
MDEAREPTPYALDRFSGEVHGWFLDAFPAGPTRLQQRAWDVIEDGDNALVIAPTGSGKTLAAFLFAIDELMREKARSAQLPKKERPGKGVRVLYISPLKALGADVERNLQAPLAGIAARLAADGAAAVEVRTGMRTGDTTPEARRSLQRNPPDILITTPESLYLMLTSQARETLRTVETVIVDEVHALAGSKRGAHLALSLERLDDLLEAPAQRIGLSATVRPRDEIARFLGGPHPVRVVASEGRPDMDVRVRVPVRDMTAVPVYGGSDLTGGDAGKRGGGRAGGPRRAPAEDAWKSDRAMRAAMASRALPTGATSPDSRVGTSSIWPYIEATILDEVLAHRTTIVFVNSRGLCEKLTARLNDLYAKRMGIARGVDEDASPAPIRSDLGSTTELSTGAPAIIAKAHHGSVSKEKRLQVERELKAGDLPCVVATSSLELGIDMGSIDLVLQVAAPPSVASALQRIGRANHQVGGRSAGSIFPRTRTEIIDAAVAAEGMYEGRIEQTALVKNALDVLAQQTVAAVAMDELAADDWYDTVRRAAPYAELPRRAFDAVLGMLAGLYATSDLAEFSPRIVWDRENGRLKARPGSQRQAVMSAGTIPDRGMFSVVLPEGGGNEGRRRVGELDEEMVYESRVGDIITLGTSSWRISEITRDRVIVEPAPGRSARLPFWHGEGVGRPAETGRMRGAFLRAIAGGIEGDDVEAEDGAFGVAVGVRERLAADGLDDDAQRNLVELVRAQRAATGTIPDDKTLVVERCEDEQGDWRVLLHSPYGRRVHEPWAMAVSDRIAQVYGYDAQAMAADDGIVLRIPMTETRLPGAELFVFDPDELDRIVRDRVNSTSLFAARFRECAARALLMSPIAPGKRAPLWQQRLKAGQLLEAARREREFPILAETARECLQDVYDMPALHELMDQVQAGSVRLVEAQTSVPSPFAAPLLFGYVGEHLYAGDLPHAEQRASLLSLDPTLLGELLGSADLGEVLDAEVTDDVESSLQRLAADRRVRGVEGVADLLRVLGPLSVEDVAQRLEPTVDAEAGDATAVEEDARAALEELYAAHRAFPVAIGGVERWAATDDAQRLRDGLGSTIPPWASAGADAELQEEEGARHPLDELLARYASTHGPFSAEAAAARFGVGVAVAHDSLVRLASAGRLMQGRFGEDSDGRVLAWVDAGVFRRLRSLSLARARRAVQAVGQDAYLRFLLDCQGVGPLGEEGFEGVDGVAQVIAQFEGVFLPAGAWEGHVFPSRVRDWRPGMLDELLASGDVVWAGARREGDDEDAPPSRPSESRSRGGREREGVGLVAFFPTDSPFAPVQADLADAPSDVPDAASSTVPPTVEQAVVDALGFGGGLFFRQIVDAVRRRLAPEFVDEAAVAVVMRELMWDGRATNDTFAPVRAALDAAGSAGPKPCSAPKRRVSSRRSGLRPADQSVMRGIASAQAAVGAALSGRWSLTMPSPANDTVRAIALVESMLDRYGVISRDVAQLSGVPGGLGALFPVLRQMEDTGEVLRGAFVQGLGPAQFAARQTVDVLRTYEANDDAAARSETVVLAADDPASLFGAGIPWPPVAFGDGAPQAERPARPTRRAGGLVVVRGGAAVLYAAPALRSLLSFTHDGEALADAVRALVAHEKRALKRAGAEGARKKVVVESFNDQPVLATPVADLLREEGLVRLPDGFRLYVDPFR